MIKSFAKVNIYLKVFKPKNKLHKIKSIFAIVDDLYDEIEIKKANIKDKVICNIKSLEKNNYIFDVLKILRNKKIISNYYEVNLHKNIPLGSGLGGGSSNAIAVAKKFTNNKKILKCIAKEIGLDCYFFIKNFYNAKVSGYGEKVKKIKNKYFIKKKDLIFTNVISVTKEVYEKFDEIKGWKNKNNLNMLEEACLLLYPELNKYKKDAYLTGSGSTFIKKIS